MTITWIAWVFTAEGIIGFLANIIVAIVLLKHPKLMHNDSSKFIVNQSLIDAIESVLLVLSRRNLFGNFGLTYTHNYTDGDFFDELVCKVWNLDTFQWAFIVCSTFNLVILTIVKYIKIVHPFWYKVQMNNKVVNVLLCLPWLLGLLYQFGLFTVRADVIGTKCVYPLWPYEIMGIIMGCIAFVLQFLLPLFIMLFCYVRIFVTIKDRHKSLTYVSTPSASSNTISVISTDVSHTNSNTEIKMEDYLSAINPSEVTQSKGVESLNDMAKKQKSQNHDKIEKKVIKMLFIVCLGFFLCWVCNQVMFFLVNIHAMHTMRGTLFYYFSIILANANCCINPFIYLTQFRKHTQLLFTKST